MIGTDDGMPRGVSRASCVRAVAVLCAASAILANGCREQEQPSTEEDAAIGTQRVLRVEIRMYSRPRRRGSWDPAVVQPIIDLINGAADEMVARPRGGGPEPGPVNIRLIFADGSGVSYGLNLNPPFLVKTAAQTIAFLTPEQGQAIREFLRNLDWNGDVEVK